MKSTKTPKLAKSIGTTGSDRDRGLPVNKPAVIDHSFVADPRGGPELRAPHGVAVKDNRTPSR
jgi:hypothetical protein